MGAFASRVTVMTGEATRHRRAARLSAKAIDWPRRTAAGAGRRCSMWSTAKWCATTPWRALDRSCRDRARALPGSRLRDEPSAGLAAEGWFHSNHMNYPYGVHIAVIAVDRDTGAVDDRALPGRLRCRPSAVNPMLVEGQIVGGCAQGIGGALLEEFLYDERGEPLSVTFADYLMPTAREMPPVDVLISRGRAEPAQSAGIEGRGRRRRQCGRRGDRRGDRRCARRARAR